MVKYDIYSHLNYLINTGIKEVWAGHVARLGENNECMPNFGLETSWKIASLQTEEDMEG
jgi:hypothetical protein